MPQQLVVQQSVRIYNELYGSHALSTYEMETGFTRPQYTSPVPLLIKLLYAQAIFSTKRKPKKMVNSNPTTKILLTSGNLV